MIENVVKIDTINGTVGIEPSRDDSGTRELRDTLGQFCTGVTAITSLTTDNKRIGITVNSFSSLSLDPPLILWNLSKDSPNFVNFDVKSPFVVNILGKDQEEIARQFAKSIPDKFLGIRTLEGLAGVPMIEGCIAYFECFVHNIFLTARAIVPVTPLVATFLPLFTLLATLVTALNARLALLIVPGLPYDLLLRTAAMRLFTARLNLLTVFLRVFFFNISRFWAIISPEIASYIFRIYK